MPYRIMSDCILRAMKPHELIAALMEQEGGSLPLARKMGNVKMQSKIYKFAAGQVGSPLRRTAEALAKYFKLPVDAIYDEKLATDIANQRGITAPPPKPAKEKKATAPGEVDEIVARMERMSADDRAALFARLGLVPPAPRPPPPASAPASAGREAVATLKGKLAATRGDETDQGKGTKQPPKRKGRKSA